jgi:YebC/PmpR family DNA-binding regulatory protein
MSGHSKWATIKRKKGAKDAERGRLFGRLIKEITVAARHGGGDPAGNPRLRTAIDTAKAANMPGSNIDRAIKKGTGELAGVTIEEATYEGYGPGGAAILVDVLTDNRNRTTAEIRHLFSKYGGRMAEAGSVAWQFQTRGSIQVDKGKADEDAVLAVALEAGAEDVVSDPSSDVYEVMTTLSVFEAVKAALATGGVPIDSSEVRKVAQNTVMVDDKDAEQLMKLMELLEEHDDVQSVAANFDIPDEVMTRLSQ